MKNNYTFLELFGDIDEKFIYEASRPWKKQVIIKYRLLKTAVAGFILLFLAAGAMTHQEEVKAAWKQFTSWIGTALGLSENVSSYTDMIGKTITRKGISVTIHEVAADKNDLWVAFSATSDSEKTEEPVLLTDVLINKQEIQLSESYPVLLENGEMQGEVSHYTIEDNIFANGEADVTISVHTASPEEIQKIDESSKSDEYVFEFKTDLKELEANTEIINIDQQIKINENQNLTVSQMRLNDFTSTISGKMTDLGEYDEYYLIGEDNLGNSVCYRLADYNKPEILFQQDRVFERYTGISPNAESVTLQLYVDKYKNKDIENKYFYTTGEEDTYGEGTGSVYEGDADLTQIYCPLGNKIEIKIR